MMIDSAIQERIEHIDYFRLFRFILTNYVKFDIDIQHFCYKMNLL